MNAVLKELNGYRYTQDWFSMHVPQWNMIFKQLGRRNAILEIGSFEGRSTCWLIENALADDGTIHCIDTWQGGEEHSSDVMNSVFETFNHNTSLALRNSKKSVRVICEPSYLALARLITEGNLYDFIYVDGSHQAIDVLTDACMAWQTLSIGGVMVFDDYLWGDPEHPQHNPKLAIDAFTLSLGNRFKVVMVGSQWAIQRVK